MSASRNQSLKNIRRLILHVGMTKAGSTALQNTLYKNYERLRSAGILFPRSVFSRGDPSDLSRTAGHLQLLNALRKDGALVDDFISEVLSVDAGCVDVIISIEALFHSATESDMKLLGELFSCAGSVVVVACLRPQYRWAQSRYYESVTKGFFAEELSFDDFLLKLKNDGSFNYADRLEVVIGGFSNVGKVVVWDYDEVVSVSDFVSFFINYFSLDKLIDDKAALVESNVTFAYPEQIEAHRRLNKLAKVLSRKDYLLWCNEVRKIGAQFCSSAGLLPGFPAASCSVIEEISSVADFDSACLRKLYGEMHSFGLRDVVRNERAPDEALVGQIVSLGAIELAQYFKKNVDQLRLELIKSEAAQRVSSQQISTLQEHLNRLRTSVSFRLGNAITRNVKSPKGWVRLPRDILQAIATRRNAVSRDGSPQLIKNVIWRAFKLVKDQGWESAISFAEQHAEVCERHSIHLFRANIAETDSIWLEQLNAYLNANNAGCVVELRDGDGGRFHRLSSAPSERDYSGPLVTVIMPAFNAEKTLRLAVGSILEQTHGNLELIIVDDCSSDSTYTIACDFAKADSRVRVLRNAVNVGPYVSKNLALRIAKGKYITGHDADDWALPNRLARDLALLDQSGGRVRAVLSHMVRMTESGQVLFFTKVGTTSSDGANRVASISLFIEAQVLKEALGGWDSVRFGADSEFIARTRQYLQEAFVQIDQVGMLCLDHESSLTSHAVHGIDRVNGLSPARLAYREAWQSWHQGLQSGHYLLAFPLISRPYEAPKVMQVPGEAVDACLSKAPATSC